jgi:hypothetical protein
MNPVNLFKSEYRQIWLPDLQTYQFSKLETRSCIENFHGGSKDKLPLPQGEAPPKAEPVSGKPLSIKKRSQEREAREPETVKEKR